MKLNGMDKKCPMCGKKAENNALIVALVLFAISMVTVCITVLVIFFGKIISNRIGNGTSSIEANSEAFTPLSYSGTGADALAGIKLPKGTYYFTFKHDGSRNFVVYVNGDLAVNQVGTLTYAYRFHSNGRTPVVINVSNADGNWALDITLEE